MEGGSEGEILGSNNSRKPGNADRMSLLSGDGPLVKLYTHITHTGKLLQCISEFAGVIDYVILRPDDGLGFTPVAERIGSTGGVCGKDCETGDSSGSRFSWRNFGNGGFYLRRCRRLPRQCDLLTLVRRTDSPADFRHGGRYFGLRLHRFPDCQLSNLTGAGVTVDRFCDNC